MTSICVKIREDYFEVKAFNAEIISFKMKLLFDFKFQLEPKGFTCKRVTFVQICKCVHNFYYAGTNPYMCRTTGTSADHSVQV